jgi:hypothetical protein
MRRGDIWRIWGGKKKCVHGFGRKTSGKDIVWKAWLNWENNIKLLIKKSIRREWNGLIWFRMHIISWLL